MEHHVLMNEIKSPHSIRTLPELPQQQYHDSTGRVAYTTVADEFRDKGRPGELGGKFSAL